MDMNMPRKDIRNTSPRPLISRLMDVRMIAMTTGSATIANLLVPGMGSAAVGAVLGAACALHILKSRDF